MSCACPPAPPNCCTPVQQCYPENFGLTFPSLVGPQGPPGGPGTFLENIAALRLLDATVFTAGYIAYVAGYYAINDGGGGLFEYDPTSTEDDNNGTTISPANAVGRWYRMGNEGFGYSPKWFGCLGLGVTDPLDATDVARFNTAFGITAVVGDERAWAFLQGIMSLSSPIVDLPVGDFWINRPVEIGELSGYASQNVRITGETNGGSYSSQQTVLRHSGSVSSHIRSNGSMRGLLISGITFDLTEEPGDGGLEKNYTAVTTRNVHAITFTSTTANGGQRNQITNCDFFNVYTCVNIVSGNPLMQCDSLSVSECRSFSVLDFMYCNTSPSLATSVVRDCRLNYYRYGFNLAIAGTLTIDTVDGGARGSTNPLPVSAFIFSNTVRSISCVNCLKEDFIDYLGLKYFLLTDAGGFGGTFTLDSCTVDNIRLLRECFLTMIGGGISGTSGLVSTVPVGVVLINTEPSGRILNLAAGSKYSTMDGYISATSVLNTGKLNLQNDCTLTTSAATPEGAITADPGSLHIRTGGIDRTFVVYKKLTGSGNTGWCALSSNTAALLQLNANETITTATNTAIPWDAADYEDAATLWDAGNPTRLVVPSGAKRIRISAGVQWSGTGGVKELFIRSQGGAVYPNVIWAFLGIPAGSAGATITTPIIRVQDITYFEVWVSQASGGNLDVLARGGLNNGSWAQIEVID